MKREAKNRTGKQPEGIPVRITMKSSRRDTQARLFETVFGSEDDPCDPNGMDLTHLSPAEETLMGILPEEDGAPTAGETNRPAQTGTPDSADTGNGEESMELITEGILTCQPDPDNDVKTYTVTYAESELTGMEGSQSSILFRTDDPGLVHMVRTGTVSTALTFREHCRAICTYDTPYIPFQVGIHSLLVDNRLEEDGTLKLEYIIEIRGAQAERCRMDMQVTPTEPEAAQD